MHQVTSGNSERRSATGKCPFHALADGQSPGNRAPHNITTALSLERLRDQAGRPPVVLLHVDADGAIMECAGPMIDAIGLSAAHLRGHKLTDIPGIPAAALQRALDGAPVMFVRSWELGGRLRHFECHLRADTNNRPGALAFAYDVTDRINAESALRRRELLLTGILENVPAIAGRLDANGSISEADGNSLAHRGLAPETLLGAQFTACFRGSEVAVERALAGGRTRFEARMNAGTADEWNLEFNLFHDHDNGQGAVFFGQDVTARRDLERQLLRAIDTERQRIGADLHDEIGQLLTGIACLSRALQDRLAARSDDAARDAATISDVATEALNQTRALSHGLSLAHLEEYGFAGALEILCARTRRMHTVDVRLRLPRTPLALDAEFAVQLHRIAQEAIANAVRHGEATKIIVAITGTATGHRLVIRDNGRGFDPGDASQRTGSGLGLMRHRAALIGGAVDLASHPDRGTRIAVHFSLNHADPL